MWDVPHACPGTRGAELQAGHAGCWQRAAALLGTQGSSGGPGAVFSHQQSVSKREITADKTRG